MASSLEIRTSRQIKRTGKHRYTGQRVWAATASSAEGMLTTVWGRPWPRMFGDATPICHTVNIVTDRPTKGISTVYAQYDTPRIIGTATRTTRSIRVLETVDHDLDGKVINGPGTIDGNPVYYRSVYGENRKIWPRGLMIVHTAYEDVRHVLYSLKVIGCIAWHGMPNIFYAGKYEIMLWDLKTWYEEAFQRLYADIYLLWEPRGWDSICAAQAYKTVPVKRQVYDEAGELTDEYRYAAEEVEVGSAESRLVHPKANLNFANSLNFLDQ